MKKYYEQFLEIANKGENAVLLAARLVLAYGFYEPAINKWSDIGSVAEWFSQGLGIPFPLLNAYLAASTEMAGVFLLALGLGVRVISLPLSVIMLVAIFLLHWENGFQASDNGFEIPLYYLLFLGLFIVRGAGKYSLDRLFLERKPKA